MATGKVIKLTDGSNILLPITDSAYIQHKWLEGATGGTTVTSVRDALNSVIDSVDSMSTSTHAQGTDLQRISYSSTNGIELSQNGGNVKLIPGSNVSLSYTSGTGLTIAATDTKVTASVKATTKLYVTGVTGTTNQSPGYDSDVFLTTTGGDLSAKYFTYSSATGGKALYTDVSKRIHESTVTSTELGYLSGATSNIQTQINNISNAITSGMHMKGTTTVGPASNVAYTDGDTYVYNGSNTYTIPAALSLTGTAQVLTKGDTFTYIASANKWAVLENNNEVATASTLGLVKSSTTGTDGTDYNVQVNNDGTMKVNVPWKNSAYIVANPATATQTNGTSGNNGVYINVWGGESASDTTTENNHSIKLVGGGPISVIPLNTGEIAISSNIISYELTNKIWVTEGKPVDINDTWLSSALGTSTTTSYFNEISHSILR